jgi:hypothetical protein
MSTVISQFEAKAYKRLYELYKSTLLTIIHNANITSYNNANDPERIKEMLKVIGDEKMWDRYSIETKENSKIIDELEKCLGV